MHLQQLAFYRSVFHRLQHQCAFAVQDVYVADVILDRDDPDVVCGDAFKLRYGADEIDGSELLFLAAVKIQLHDILVHDLGFARFADLLLAQLQIEGRLGVGHSIVRRSFH